MPNAMQDFFKAWNAGKDIDVREGGSAYSECLIKVLSVDVRFGDNNHENPVMHYPEALFLVFELGVQAGEFKGLKLEQPQRIFVNEDGSLSNPVTKSYEKKDGSTQASSFSYDILDAARAEGDDRFGSIDISNKEKMELSFKNLTFKMGIKKGITKDGREFYTLNTHYQQLRDQEYRERQATSNNAAEATKQSLNVDPDDLPF